MSCDLSVDTAAIRQSGMALENASATLVPPRSDALQDAMRYPPPDGPSEVRRAQLLAVSRAAEALMVSRNLAEACARTAADLATTARDFDVFEAQCTLNGDAQ